MLPATFRLSRKEVFARIFQKGSYAALGEIAIKWMDTTSPTVHVGFIASKKTFSKAHERNKAKRIAREALRPYVFQLRPGFDMIVLYRYKPKALDFHAVQRSIESLLKQNNLLK